VPPHGGLFLPSACGTGRHPCKRQAVDSTDSPGAEFRFSNEAGQCRFPKTTLRWKTFIPIDIVETLAEHHAWEFDRVTDDQIAMAVEGQWRTYSLTLAWSDADETLRLICTFEMEPARRQDPQAV
jgi:hypothetical protein